MPLTELDADSDGDAEAETGWEDNDLDHLATGHYVAIHELSTDDGVRSVIRLRGCQLAVLPRDVVHRREAGTAPPTPPCGRR